MKQGDREPADLLTEPAPAVEAAEHETTLVHVLTDFLRGAGKYILEEDYESYCV